MAVAAGEEQWRGGEETSVNDDGGSSGRGGSAYAAAAAAAAAAASASEKRAAFEAMSHLTGCRGEHVARLFTVMPQLEEIERLETQSSSAAAGAKRAAVFDRAYGFTRGQTLREWLANGFEWKDPITLSPLPAPSNGVATGSALHRSGGNVKNGVGESDAYAAWDETMVDEGNLLEFLRRIERLWLRDGIDRQVRAFRDGLGSMAALDCGVLSFEAAELRDLLCGPDSVDWTEASLRKTLRCKGGLDPNEDTMVWLRAELVGMEQLQRLRFMRLVTGLPLLTPDKVITISATKNKWAYFHSCTSTLDFPRFDSQEKLRYVLAEAMANGDAGGFSEIERNG